MQRPQGRSSHNGALGNQSRGARLFVENSNECVHCWIVPFDLVQVRVHQFDGRYCACTNLLCHLAKRQAVGH